jgi:hypothetical protein
MNRLASRRSRVVSTGPAGDEPCLRRAMRSCRAGSTIILLRLGDDSLAHSRTDNRKDNWIRESANPARCLTRDSPNVPLAARASKQLWQIW